MAFPGPRVDGKSQYTRKHSYIVVNEELYAAGGYYPSPESTTSFKMTGSFTKYDPDTNKWIALSRVKTQRVGCLLVESDGYIYALGDGREGDGKSDSTTIMEKYNIKENKWTSAQSMPVFSNHKCAVGFKSWVVVNVGHQLYIYKLGKGWRRQEIAGKELLSPIQLLQAYKTKHPPVLMVHDNRCYYIMYNKQASGGLPVVRELIFNETDDASKNTVTMSACYETPEMPDNNCGAFAIDNLLFINIKGCVYNTGIEMTDPARQSKMDEWQGVMNYRKGVDPVVGYTFDLQCLRKK